MLYFNNLIHNIYYNWGEMNTKSKNMFPLLVSKSLPLTKCTGEDLDLVPGCWVLGTAAAHCPSDEDGSNAVKKNI